MQNSNSALPIALLKLIEAFSQLPGVGSKTAERYAYACLKGSVDKSTKLADALASLHESITYCPVTFALIDKADNVSPLYSDPKRDKTLVAIVENPFDILAIENTNQFNGTYHVLGGSISPIDGVNPNDLHIPELLERLEKDNVKEIILATNANVEGEATSLYIQQSLKNNPKLANLKVTKLARGLPMGIDLEYADQITISHALGGRQEVSDS